MVVVDERAGGGCLDEPRAAGPRRPRLLLVDDDKAVLRTFSRFFGDAFEVMAVTDPAAALSILGNGVHVDALLTDYAMGQQMNGVELLGRVRDAFPTVARFLTSGGGLKDAEIERHRQDGLLLGFLPKPLESDAAARFAELVLDAIRRHE